MSSREPSPARLARSRSMRRPAPDRAVAGRSGRPSRGLVGPTRAVHGAYDERLRVETGVLAVRGDGLRRAVVGVVALHEGDDAAAEPGAGEPGADCPVLDEE